jgi:RNA-splicing ligase RtcB
MIEYIGKYTMANVMIDSIDETTASQIVEFVNHEAFTNRVVIMPDTHAGKGSVIGFTMPVGICIIPNTIGVN